jgi:hypothetical protein
MEKSRSNFFEKWLVKCGEGSSLIPTRYMKEMRFGLGKRRYPPSSY